MWYNCCEPGRRDLACYRCAATQWHNGLHAVGCQVLVHEGGGLWVCPIAGNAWPLGGNVSLPEISGHGPIFSVYSSVYAIVEVNGRRWELGIKHRR